MTITLRELTQDTWSECAGLAVCEDQRGFVAPNLKSIAEVQFYPGMVCRAVYADETMVGLMMFGPDDGYAPLEERPSAYALVRLMIDQRYQGRGYGRAALETLIAYLRAERGCRALYLSYVPGNTQAERLYSDIGFRPTGLVQEGEIVLRLALGDAPAAS